MTVEPQAYSGAIVCLQPTSQRQTDCAIELASQLTAVAGGRWQIIEISADAESQRSHGASVYASLSNALNDIAADRILFLDAEQEFGPELIARWVTRSNEVRALVGDARRPSRRLARLMMLVFQWIARVCLKTRANRWRPAVLEGPRAVFSSLLPQLGRSATIGELIARVRYAQIPVIESTWSNETVPSSIELAVRDLGVEQLRYMRHWWNELKFSPSDDDSRQRPTHALQRWAAAIALFLVTLIVLSLNLNYPLFEPDEARNAQISLNIVQTGDWLSLQLDGEPYWDKPPMMAWLIAASYHLFGVSEFATRLPGNLIAIAVVIVTFVVGRQLIGFWSAWLGGLALALSLGFVVCGRYVTMDAALTLTATITLWSAVIACRQPRFSYRWWLASAVAGGCGLLIKGPIIVILTLPVLIAVHVLENNRSLLNLRRWLVYLGTVAVIAGPWYLATAWVHPDFLLYFFWKQNVVRFSNAFNHQEPWWFYLPVIVLALFPMSYLIPSLLRSLWFNDGAHRRLRPQATGMLVLSSAWVLLFFSASTCKLPTYILPAFPALCLLLGTILRPHLFAAMPASALGPSVALIPRKATGLMALLVLIAAVVYHLWLTRGDAVTASISAAVVGGLLFLTWQTRRFGARPRLAWTCFAVATVVFVSWNSSTFIPAISSARSIQQAMATIRQRKELKDVPLVFYCHEAYGASLWLGEGAFLEFTDEERLPLQEYLVHQRQVLLVSRDESIRIMQLDLPWPLHITEVPGARHLYLCAERNPSDHAPRMARRYDPTAAITH